MTPADSPRPRLAPHDLELVEADARYLFEQTVERDPVKGWAGAPTRWEDGSDTLRQHFRDLAADPYGAPR